MIFPPLSGLLFLKMFVLIQPAGKYGKPYFAADFGGIRYFVTLKRLAIFH
jgi:hypothetical protein